MGDSETEDDDKEEKKTRKQVLKKEKIEKKRRKKQDAKLRQIEKQHWTQKWNAKMGNFIDKTIGRFTIEISFLDKFSKKQQKEVVSGIKGVLFGIVMSYIFFFLLVYTFRRDLEIALYFCMVLLIAGMFGISFSNNIRCVFFLVIPTLASSRLRWVLLMYGTVLTMLGPGINIMKNSLTLRSSISCVYHQLKTNFEMLRKILDAPKLLILKSFTEIIKLAKIIWRRLYSAIKLLKNNIMNSGNAVSNQVNYFQLIMNACNNKLALYNQCVLFFNNIYHNCYHKMPRVLRMMCYIVRYVSMYACRVSSKMGKICDNARMKITKHNSTTARNMIRKVDSAFERLKLRVGRHETVVDFNETNLKIDKSSGGIKVSNVSDELKEKSEKLMTFITTLQRFFQIISIFSTLIAVSLVFLNSIGFKKLWLKKDSFQNHYLTTAFSVLERNAMDNKLPLVLPLIGPEKKKYITFSSFYWSKSEKVAASRGAGVIFVSCVTMASTMCMDFIMYSVVLILEPIFDNSYIPEKSIQMNIVVLGVSTIASFVKAILKLLGPLRDFITDIDMPLCKPVPQTPNIATNSIIFCIVLITLFSLVFQVQILRLRHRIMIHFFPERAFQRAVWLRNYIRNTRGSIKNFMFSNIGSKFNKNKQNNRNSPNLSIIGLIITHSKFWAKILSKLGQTREFCRACSTEGNPKNIEDFSRNFSQCSLCKSFFCKPCYVYFNHLCLTCRLPLNTTETEIDMHKLSSDEEYEHFKSRYINIINKDIDTE